MRETEYKVLTYANQPGGAADYLFKKEIASLAKRGLIERMNDFAYRATEEGRRVWLRGGAPAASSKRTASLRRAKKRSRSGRQARARHARTKLHKRLSRRRRTMSLPKVPALRWFKVYTERNPQGTFVQARSNSEAADKAERDGRGRVLRVEYAQE